MKIWESFQTDLISLGFSLLGAAIFYIFRSRARLVWGKLHEFVFLVPGFGGSAQPSEGTGTEVVHNQLGALNVHTLSVVILNWGILPATDVEVTFNWMPQNYNIWPVRPYTTQENPDRRFTLNFANVAPKERFQIELFSFGHLPAVLNVRSRECVGRQIPIWPVRRFPQWFLVMLWVFVLLGVAFCVETIIKLSLLIWSGVY